MANTALTDLISLLQASNSNSEPVIQGKGPVLQQTGSGVINVPQQAQQKQKTPLEQAGDAIKVAKAYQDLQNTNSNSLSNIRFNAPEPDTSSYLSDAFANSNFEEQAPIFTGSTDGALAMNAPQFNSDINYSNGFNYEPVASTTDTPEDTQVVTQQATPEQNNPAQESKPNTVTSIDGSTLSTIDLANTAPRDLPIEDMSPEELMTYNIAQAKKAGEQARKDVRNRELQEARDYAQEYGLTDEGLPYRKINGKAFPISKFSEKGKEIIARLSSPIMVAALAMSDPVAATPQDTGSVQTEQRGAIADAGKAVTAQQQQTSTDNGALSNAGKISDSSYNPTGIFDGSQPEFNAFNRYLVQLGATNSAPSLATVNQLKNSINNVTNNAIENYGLKSAALGNGESVTWTFNNIGADATKVARQILANRGVTPDKTNVTDIAGIISNLQEDYPNLPPAVIGAALNTYMISDSQTKWNRGETSINDDYQYKDSLKDALKDLNDPNSATNWKALKQDYIRLNDYFDQLDGLQSKFDKVTAAINKQTQLATIYKYGVPNVQHVRDTIKEADDNALSLSKDLGVSLSNILEKVYSTYKPLSNRNTESN